MISKDNQKTTHGTFNTMSKINIIILYRDNRNIKSTFVNSYEYPQMTDLSVVCVVNLFRVLVLLLTISRSINLYITLNTLGTFIIIRGYINCSKYSIKIIYTIFENINSIHSKENGVSRVPVFRNLAGGASWS